jgi:hypothetical protein
LPALVRTELAAGTLRGSRVLAPEDVARAIVATAEHPRFEVYVPRPYGPLTKIAGALPRPARDVMLRAGGTERATARTTPADRAAYEARVDDGER